MRSKVWNNPLDDFQTDQNRMDTFVLAVTEAYNDGLSTDDAVAYAMDHRPRSLPRKNALRWARVILFGLSS